jgi:hypothetical protein
MSGASRSKFIICVSRARVRYLAKRRPVEQERRSWCSKLPGRGQPQLCVELCLARAATIEPERRSKGASERLTRAPLSTSPRWRQRVNWVARRSRAYRDLPPGRAPLQVQAVGEADSHCPPQPAISSASSTCRAGAMSPPGIEHQTKVEYHTEQVRLEWPQFCRLLCPRLGVY